MGVQKKIVKRVVDCGTITIDGEQKAIKASTGANALGVPGDVADLAFGPVVHTEVLEADAVIGTLVADKGVLISPHEYALMGGLGPSMKLMKGMVGEFMTAGHVKVYCKDVADILAAMNGKVLYGKDDTSADTDICVIEVLGFKAAEESDSSSAS